MDREGAARVSSGRNPNVPTLQAHLSHEIRTENDPMKRSLEVATLTAFLVAFLGAVEVAPGQC